DDEEASFELEQDDDAEESFELEQDEDAEESFELELDEDAEEAFELEQDDDDDEEDSDRDELEIPDDLDIATPSEIEDSEQVSVEDKTESEEDELKLDNPDLDLAALLSDIESDSEGEAGAASDDFLDVESLLNDGDDTNAIDPDSQALDLDVSLSDFTGVSDEDTVIDIDKDAGQNANLDLARAYIEMDDVDAARELLEEVMKEGSEEQKQEAASILANIE
ncbi:FimV/HubP family polar landmark protein, partial [Alteromonas sp. KUL106]|uniref:FimV/HubP family polar landmark protein n=1 Tax=Alteromonas sp. KUL106 TaxID=2480799 RepID=UPI0027E43C15